MKLWCNISALNRAAHACIKHKRSRSDAVAFRMHWGEEILSLARRLESGKYQPEAGKVFVTSRPKHREIHAAAFRDRVVHHLLYGLLEPYFEARFIADSYACRKGKGTHAAVRRLQQMMWNITRHGKVSAFALKMDIKSFFPSIHKPTLFGFLQKAKTELTDESFWKLVKTVVFNNAAASAIPCSPAWRFQQVPHHKRLGSKGSDYGLPIGNLTSQFFANVYLNNLDYFVKRTLAARYYVRYVDDFVLLHNSPQTLKIWKNKIENFLKIHLQLEAHEAEEIHCVGRGVDFVGYIVRPKYLLPRRRTVANLNKHVTQQEAALCPKVVLEEQHVDLHQVGSVKGPCKIQPIEYGRLEKLRATWASYEGHFRHCNAFGLRMRIWKKHPLSKSILHQGLRVTRRFALPKFAASLNEQFGRLSQGLGNTVLLVQVGCRARCPRIRDANLLGISPVGKRGRLFYEAPWSKAPLLVQKSISHGASIAVAVEESCSAGNVKTRRLAWLIEPMPPASQNLVAKNPKPVLAHQLFLPGFEKWLLTSKK